MKKLSSAEIRQRFLDFFQGHGHQIVKSGSLVPGNDPTLLFTNAGMVPFKDVFLGQERRDYVRATSSQRCVRAGGKHNDLENVGYTARHHTFFEMLGNFSFGDYFKREAIQYAWQFLTVELGLPAEKLWITVFDEDIEAEKIWLEEVGVSAERFSRIGAKDNFWSMGDTGPCGPCSEIFYDHGADVPGGPPGTPEEDGDRYIEIWNLVFMQYNQSADGTRQPLPKPSVDTGMGLERLAAVLQGVHENYEIDLFQALLTAVQQQTGHSELMASSHKVIADHIRSSAFMLVDGVLPSNEGRGYVLRRIIRRAIRHAYKLGVNKPFFNQLVAPLVAVMGDAYPELRDKQAQIEQHLLREEQRFAETLDKGMRILDEVLKELNAGAEIPGDIVFKLYDTYGFPVDLTADIARERELTLDMQGYQQALEQQRDRGRQAGSFGKDYNDNIEFSGRTEFSGYDGITAASAVLALYKDGQPVERLAAGDMGVVVLQDTPFYAESGGQVGDQGTLTGPAGRFMVEDTVKQAGSNHVHIGRVALGGIELGQTLQAQVDGDRRRAVERNHSATHLLHSALREVLGEHVQQKGSLVDAQRLRFDFSNPEPVSAAEISKVERLVNERILANKPAAADEMSYDDAIAAGAMALFGEKYGDSVRVVQFAEFSTELCGGTHVQRTGDIGLLKIVQETGVASGIRRLEAVTGEAALDFQAETEQLLGQVAKQLKSAREAVVERLEQQLQRSRELEKELTRLQSKAAASQGGALAERAVTVAGIKVLAEKIDGVDGKQLRETVDQLKQKLGTAAIVLAAVSDKGKVSLVAGVSNDATDRVQAGKLVNHVALQVGGKGGGRADMAQAGGNDASQLKSALSSVADYVAGLG